jgi:hypothetical protein
MTLSLAVSCTGQFLHSDPPFYPAILETLDSMKSNMHYLELNVTN